MTYFRPFSRYLLVSALCLAALCEPSFAAIDKPKGNPLPAEAPSASADNATPAPAPATPLPVSPGQYLSGKFAEVSGDRAAAIRYLRQALKQDPANKEFTVKLYHYLLLEGDIPGALAVARTLDTNTQESFTPALLVAAEKIHNNDLAGAQALLAKTDGNQISTLILPVLQAWVKIGLKQAKQPFTFEDLGSTKHAEEAPFSAYHLALLNDAAGFRPQAEELFDQALTGVKKVPYRIYEQALGFYTRNGSGEKAAELTKRYQTQSPDSLLFGTPATLAKPEVDSASKGFAEVFYSLASVLHNANAVEEEEIFLRLALYLQPDFPSVQFLLANALEQAGEYESAIATYKGINPASPFYDRGRIRTAYDLSLSGKREEALKRLSELSRSGPPNADVLLTRADILRNSDRYVEAITAYSMAINAIGKPQASDWPVFYSRGICYERAGQWPKAEADFLKSLELQPGQPDVLNYLGYSWLVMGRNQEKALHMIEQAMEARPEDMHIIDSMGWGLYLTGDYDSAVEYLEQGVELAPNDPTVNEHLGDVYWRLGRKTEANFQWQRALLFKPDVKTEKAIRQKLVSGLPPSPARKKAPPTEGAQIVE